MPAVSLLPVPVAMSGDATSPPRGRPSPSHTTSSTAAGSSSAVSFSQYWKACTKVIERIPPEVTLASTTPATSATPTHGGASIAASSVSPAPWNCGSR